MTERAQENCPIHGRWTYLPNTPRGPQSRRCPECPSGVAGLAEALDGFKIGGKTLRVEDDGVYADDDEGGSDAAGKE